MKISREMEEKIILVIQAIIGFLVIGWSIKSSVKTQSQLIRKAMEKSTKLAYKQQQKEYRMQNKAFKRAFKERAAQK